MTCCKSKNIEELFEKNKYIIDYIVDNLLENDLKDEDEYCEKLHIFIHDYVESYSFTAKKLVNDYNVFRSIKLCKKNYGYFEIDDDINNNYIKLGYVLIDEWFSEYYSFEDLIRLKEYGDDDSDVDSEE